MVAARPGRVVWVEAMPMSKGLLFWIIWIFCLLTFVGVSLWGWPAIYSGGVMLVLFGLLGWHNFGPPVQ